MLIIYFFVEIAWWFYNTIGYVLNIAGVFHFYLSKDKKDDGIYDRKVIFSIYYNFTIIYHNHFTI